VASSVCVCVISSCVICVVCVDSDKSSCLFSICYSNQSISLFIKHTVTKPAAHEARPENGKCCVRKNESERERKRLEMSERERDKTISALCGVLLGLYRTREGYNNNSPCRNPHQPLLFCCTRPCVAAVSHSARSQNCTRDQLSIGTLQTKAPVNNNS